MAKIAGITIELGADPSGIEKALKDVDKSLKETQSNLKDINKLLKFDGGNVTLLTQKQKELGNAIDKTKQRLSELKKAQSGVAKGSAEWEALQREIIATEQNLKKLEKQKRQFGNVTSQVLKAAGAKMQEYGHKVEEVGKKLSKISGVAAGALGAIGKLGYDVVQSADELATLSQQTGVSVEELQKWQYASELVDVSVSDMTGAMTKMKAKMVDGNKTFKSLGVSIRDADGNMRSASDVFYNSLFALSQIENETERDQLAMELFGKSADQLAGIIDDGGTALRMYGKEAEQMGVIMSEDTVDDLNQLNDVITKTKNNVKGSLAKAGATLATTFAPVLEKISDLIGQVTERIRALTPAQAETIVKVLGIIAVVGPVILTIGKLITGIGSIISVIGTVVGVLGGPLTLAIAAVIAAGILLWKNWDKIKAFAIQLKDRVIAAWEGLKTGVQTACENVKTAAITAWEGLKEKVNSIVEGVRSKIQALIDKFNDAKEKIKTAIQNIKNAMNFTWSFPKIKLPHFKVTGGVAPYGLGGSGSLPKIDIEWYKRAYDNPVMFTSPTVMATPGGYKGFGDGAGAEIVMGLDKLREVVGSGQNVNVNVYLQGDAAKLFKVLSQTNNARTRATGYNALAAMGV